MQRAVQPGRAVAVNGSCWQSPGSPAAGGDKALGKALPAAGRVFHALLSLPS